MKCSNCKKSIDFESNGYIHLKHLYFCRASCFNSVPIKVILEYLERLDYKI